MEYVLQIFRSFVPPPQFYSIPHVECYAILLDLYWTTFFSMGDNVNGVMFII